MIVECIADNWTIVYRGRGARNPEKPKKGNLYEVCGENNYKGEKYYLLRELDPNWVWNAKKFREVDIDISDATEKKITELPIKVLI